MNNYNLELKKVVDKINSGNSKLVCIQLPDGLKPKAEEIVDKVSSETGARILIWLGSNFGACDMPLGLEKLGVDLLVSWGHNVFHKEEGW